MTVISEDMKSRIVTRKDLLPLSFLEKSPYTGSKRKLRYRMEKVEYEVPAAEREGAAGEEYDETEAEKAGVKKQLRVSAWFGPFAFDRTERETMTVREFGFDNKGIDAAISFLNGLLIDSERA